jgi:hypothetical protein
MTLFVNVTDILPPVITLVSPLNGSYTSGMQINFTTNEYAYCNATFSTGYNISIIHQPGHRYLAFVTSLQDGIYNLTIDCVDTVNLSSSLAVYNITLDTIPPILNISYPTSNLIIQGHSFMMDYTLTEINTDKVWYTMNHNPGNQYMTPGDTEGETNEETLSLSFPGKQSLSLYANDSAGNIASINRTFFTNHSFNGSAWASARNHSLLNTTSVVLYNSTNDISQNETVSQMFTLFMDFSSLEVYVYNFSGLTTSWNSSFSAHDNNSVFVQNVNTVLGADPINYVTFSNFSRFISNTSDYYGRIELPGNITSYNNIVYYCSQDDLSDCARVQSCTGGYNKTSSIACYTSLTDSL